MSLDTAVLINGFDLLNLGFRVTSVTGPGASPGNRWATQQLPTRAGLLLLDGRPTLTTRQIVVTGILKQSTMAAFLAALDQLKALCTSGALEVSTIDQPTRFFYARMDDQGHTPPSAQFLNPYATLTLTFEALDPYGYDIAPEAVAFGASRVAIPLGTAPVAPILRIMGAATNPTITYRHSSGEPQQTIALTVTLLSTDYLDIDGGAKTITKYTSGVASSLLSAIAGSDFPLLSPEHGDYLTASWPTLEVSAGAGLALYRKAWN